MLGIGCSEVIHVGDATLHSGELLGAVVSVAKRAMHCRWQRCIPISTLQGDLN